MQRLHRRIKILDYLKDSKKYSLDTALYVNIQLGLSILFFLVLIIDGILGHYPEAKILWIIGTIVPLAAAEAALRRFGKIFTNVITPIAYTFFLFFGLHFSGSILTPSILFSFLGILIISIMAKGLLRIVCVLSVIIFVIMDSYGEMLDGHVNVAEGIYIDWMIYFSLISLVVLWIIDRIINILQDSDKAIKQANAELYSISITDSLTEAYNRRYFNKYIEKISRAQRKRTSFAAVLMIDIDFFKQYNDHYGHVQGDICLKQVVSVMKKSLHRETDLVFRLGGEEFLIFIEEIESDGINEITNRIHQNLAEEKIQHIKSRVSPYVTVSIGAVSFDMDKHENWIDIIKIVDDAMYQAKRAGRNKTVNVCAI